MWCGLLLALDAKGQLFSQRCYVPETMNHQITFNEWIWALLKRVRTAWIVAVGTIAAASAVWQRAWVHSTCEQLAARDFRWARVLLAGAQVAFAAFAVWHLTSLRRTHKVGPDPDTKVETAYQDFWKAWLGLWVAWVCLYSVVFFLLFPKSPSLHVGPWLEILGGPLVNAVGNLTNAFILVCYLTLRHMKAHMHRWLPIVMCYSLIVLAELVLRCFVDPMRGPFPLDTQAFGRLDVAFQFVNGTLGVISLAMFVGRLESLWLRAPGWVIAAFYGYAAIQAYQVAVTDVANGAAGFLMMLAALLLKMLLYVFVYFLLTQGMLPRYFKMVGALHAVPSPVEQ